MVLILLALAVVGHHLVDQLVLLLTDALARYTKFILNQLIDSVVVLSGTEYPRFHVKVLNYVEILQV